MWDSIYKKVKFLLGDNDSIARKASIFYCHRFNGVPLKEIGAHFGISESGVSLASSRFSQVLQRNKKLRKKIELVQNQLNL